MQAVLRCCPRSSDCLAAWPQCENGPYSVMSDGLPLLQLPARRRVPFVGRPPQAAARPHREGREVRFALREALLPPSRPTLHWAVASPRAKCCLGYLREGRTPSENPTNSAVPCRAGRIDVYAAGLPGMSLARTSTSSSRYSAEVRDSACSAGAKAQSRRASLPFPPLVAERAALSPLERMLRG